LVIGVVLSNVHDLAFFSWSSLMTLLASYLVYYLIISTITVLVSLFSKSSGTSLVCTLLIWILFSFITPKVATNFANEAHPYPSKSEFNAAVVEDKKNGLDGHNPWNEAAQKLELETLEEYGVEKISELPFNYSGYRMQKGEEHEAQIYKKHYDILNEIAIKQNKVYESLSFLSPFISLRFLSMDVSNTSDKLHWKFTNAAEKYRLQKQEFLNYDIKDNSKYGERGYNMTEEKFKQLPKFNFTPPTNSEIIKENTQNILFLCLWLFLPFVGLLIFSKNK
jgi:ABC-2 type transport system permease protein